jgi:ABC-type lipoprotein export system ATPase subunit
VEILKNLAHTENYLIIVITHNPMVCAEADTVNKAEGWRTAKE